MQIQLVSYEKELFWQPYKSPGKRIHPLQCNLCIPHEMPLTKYTWSSQSPVSADMNTVRALMSLKHSVLFQNTGLMHGVLYTFVLNLYSTYRVDPDHTQKWETFYLLQNCKKVLWTRTLPMILAFVFRTFHANWVMLIQANLPMNEIMLTVIF